MRRDWQQAATPGDWRTVAQLLATGCDVNARDEQGQTALMRAALRGHREVVESLIGGGADLDHTAKYHLTALMLAVLNGHTDVVRLLVEAGANLGVRGTGAPGFAGKTALDLAEAHGDAEMVDVLREAGP